MWKLSGFFEGKTRSMQWEPFPFSVKAFLQPWPFLRTLWNGKDLQKPFGDQKHNFHKYFWECLRITKQIFVFFLWIRDWNLFSNFKREMLTNVQRKVIFPAYLSQAPCFQTLQPFIDPYEWLSNVIMGVRKCLAFQVSKVVLNLVSRGVWQKIQFKRVAQTILLDKNPATCQATSKMHQTHNQAFFQLI